MDKDFKRWCADGIDAQLGQALRALYGLGHDALMERASGYLNPLGWESYASYAQAGHIDTYALAELCGDAAVHVLVNIGWLNAAKAAMQRESPYEVAYFLGLAGGHALQSYFSKIGEKSRVAAGQGGRATSKTDRDIDLANEYLSWRERNPHLTKSAFYNSDCVRGFGLTAEAAKKALNKGLRLLGET